MAPTAYQQKILKEFIAELSVPMINVSFNKGIFPDFLKVANIISVHKKGDSQHLQTNLPNYPI